MMIELDSYGLRCLVNGVQPAPHVYDLIKEYGYYDENHKRWVWDLHVLKQCGDPQLLAFYFLCRDSWNPRQEKVINDEHNITR